jgi:hypothetical protein
VDLAEPPHKPEKPAPRKKQAKSGKPGPHKFASGIPRYD